MKLVTFQLGLDLFGADVLSVDRVLRYSPPNCVPDVPSWIEGVIEHRGKVVPIVDLRRRVELSDDSITPETRILVLNTPTGYVGVIVDMVHEVAMIAAASVSPPPPLFRGLPPNSFAASPRFAINWSWFSTSTVCWRAPIASRSISRRRLGEARASWLSERSTSFGRGGRRSTRDSTSPAPQRSSTQLKAQIGALFKAVEQEIAGTERASAPTCCSSWRSGRGVKAQGQPSRRAAVRAAKSRGCTPTTSARRPSSRRDGARSRSAITPARKQRLTKALQLSPNDPQAESLLGWALMLQDKFDDALLNFQKVLVREPQNALARINVGYICLKKGIFGEAIEHLSRAIRLDNDKKATLYAHFYLGLVYLERDMFEDAQTFFQKTIALGPNLIEAYYELGRAYWFNGQRDEAIETWKSGFAANKFNPWGKRCADVLKTVEAGESPRRSRASAVACAALSSRLAVLLAAVARRVAARAQDAAPERLDRGRFTAVFFPGDRALATSLLDGAVQNDTFPGLAAAAPARAAGDRAGPSSFSRVGRSGRARVGRGDHLSGIAAHRDAGTVERERRRRSARSVPPRGRAPGVARIPGRLAAALVRRGLRELCGARVDARGCAGGEPRAGAARHADVRRARPQFAGGSATAQNAYALGVPRGGRARVDRYGARAFAVLRHVANEPVAWTWRCARRSA